MSLIYFFTKTMLTDSVSRINKCANGFGEEGVYIPSNKKENEIVRPECDFLRSDSG